MKTIASVFAVTAAVAAAAFADSAYPPAKAAAQAPKTMQMAAATIAVLMLFFMCVTLFPRFRSFHWAYHMRRTLNQS